MEGKRDKRYQHVVNTFHKAIINCIVRFNFNELSPRTKIAAFLGSIYDRPNPTSPVIPSRDRRSTVSLSFVASIYRLSTATLLINLYIIEIGDCPISVDRDSHQMQYRGSAAENVAAGPHVAKLGPQRPFRVYL